MNKNIVIKHIKFLTNLRLKKNTFGIQDTPIQAAIKIQSAFKGYNVRKQLLYDPEKYRSSLRLLQTKNDKIIKQIDPNSKDTIKQIIKSCYISLYNTDYEKKESQFENIYRLFVIFVGEILNKSLYDNKLDEADIMKIQFFKFFDNNKSCIIKKIDYTVIIYVYINKNIYTDIKIFPDIQTFNIGLSSCEYKNIKYPGQNILATINIIFIIDNIESDQGHSNTLIFDKKTKFIWRVEPNYDIRIKDNNTILFNTQINTALNKYFDNKIIGYTFKGLYPYTLKSCSKHGGLCLFVFC